MRVIDLFCGAGGFSTGFQQAGHKIVYAIDNDPRVKKTYQKNHPHTKFFLRDIRGLNPKDFTDVDIVIGSPPCIDFSVANTKKDTDRGMVLVKEFLRWVSIIQPKWWIMENVPQIYSHLQSKLYPMKKVILSADYGVPQFRKRCFAGKYKIPRPTHGKVSAITLDGRKLKRWVTVKDAIGDLIGDVSFLILTDQRGSKKMCSNSPFYDAINRPARTITNIPPRKLIDPSTLNQEVLKKHPPMKLNFPSRTLLANLKRQGQYGLLDLGEKCVQLTIRECARLQSFPDEFEFKGTKTGNYMLIGNAVPPLMARHLGVMLR